MTKLSTKIEIDNSQEWFSQKHQNQIRFENEMKSFVPQLVSVIEDSFEKMKSQISLMDPHCLSPNSHAQRMHEQIRGKIFEQFGAPQNDLSRIIWFQGNFACLFNKMDVSGRPFHNNTGEALRIVNQGVIQHNGEKTIVHIGYVVNPGWTHLRKIYASGLSNGQVVWTIDLRQFATEQAKSIRLTSNVNEKSVASVVRAKKDKNKDKLDGKDANES